MWKARLNRNKIHDLQMFYDKNVANAEKAISHMASIVDPKGIIRGQTPKKPPKRRLDKEWFGKKNYLLIQRAAWVS